VIVPRYPAIQVTTAGTGGNRLALLGRVLTAMNRAEVPPAEIAAFQAEVNAMPPAYDDLLGVCARWVTVREPS
jgi:hypothetical protein